MDGAIKSGRKNGMGAAAEPSSFSGALEKFSRRKYERIFQKVGVLLGAFSVMHHAPDYSERGTAKLLFVVSSVSFVKTAQLQNKRKTHETALSKTNEQIA